MSEAQFNAIRTQYPNPVNRKTMASLGEGDNYCVGAAACRYAKLRNEDQWAFPSSFIIAEALLKLNPALEGAVTFADKIVSYNDSGHFGTAWTVLKLALTQEKD